MTFFPKIVVIILLNSFVFHIYAKTDVTIQDKIDTQLIKNAKRFGVVGQSVLVLKNQEPIYRGVHGYANKELSVSVNKNHKFPSYSVAKLFTSVLMMQLAERGDVDIKQPIRVYLPHLTNSWQDVTVEHLLSHTSGIPRYFDRVIKEGSFLPDKDTVYRSLANQPEHFKIGTKNAYNNTNFLLLASILEKKTNKSFHQLVQEKIIQPLRLKNTGFASAKSIKDNMVSSYVGAQGQLRKNLAIDWPEYTYSHSALYSTPEELAQFMTALTMGQLVKLKTLSRLWKPMKLSSGNSGRYAFGFEYSIEDNFIRVGHDGGNRVKLRHYYNVNNTEDNYTLVYMTNGNTYDVWTDVLADSIMSKIAPNTFLYAVLKDQYIEAVLTNDNSTMNNVFRSLKQQVNDESKIESFFRYCAYAVKYGAGINASLPAFSFLVEKFPESYHAKQSFNETINEIKNSNI